MNSLEKMNALVLADIDKRIEGCFPQLSFKWMGYAVEPHIPLSHEEILKEIPDIDILICEFDSIDREVIDAAKSLKMIVCCRGGVHTVIDVSYATMRGIIVKNTPGRNASAVVEYVLGVLINHDRHLSLANEQVLSDTLQKQKYYKPDNYRDSLWGMDINSPYHKLRGKGLHSITLGVIGYGNIGRSVVNAAVSLGIHVLIYNHHPILAPVASGAEIVDKEYLLANSDYVSLHCNNRAHEIVIGNKELSSMKRSAFLINSARGDILDEEALIDALNKGIIGGAALDVTRQEPLPENSPLIKCRNIFITPHIAGATDEVIQIGTDMTIYYIREFFTDIRGLENE